MRTVDYCLVRRHPGMSREGNSIPSYGHSFHRLLSLEYRVREDIQYDTKLLEARKPVSVLSSF